MITSLKKKLITSEILPNIKNANLNLENKLYNSQNDKIMLSLSKNIDHEDNPFEGKIKNYIIEALIGTGAGGNVRIAVNKINGKKYALKIYEKIKLCYSFKKASVKSEIEILKSIHHPNIVEILESIETNKQVIIY